MPQGYAKGSIRPEELFLSCLYGLRVGAEAVIGEPPNSPDRDKGRVGQRRGAQGNVERGPGLTLAGTRWSQCRIIELNAAAGSNYRKSHRTEAANTGQVEDHSERTPKHPVLRMASRTTKDNGRRFRRCRFVRFLRGLSPRPDGRTGRPGRCVCPAGVCISSRHHCCCPRRGASRR